MNDPLHLQILVDAFLQKSEGKYILSEHITDGKYFESLAPAPLVDIKVLRMQRLYAQSSNFKTLLFAVLENVEDFVFAFNWIASVKEELIDPESSDLYFIAGVRGEVSTEFCTNVESSEQFCRKYILRPGEETKDFVDRTFMSDLTTTAVQDDIVDPLYTAIQKTAMILPAFTAEKQEHWRRVLLSGNSGAELIDDLFKQVAFITKNSANETSGEDNNQ